MKYVEVSFKAECRTVVTGTVDVLEDWEDLILCFCRCFPISYSRIESKTLSETVVTFTVSSPSLSDIQTVIDCFEAFCFHHDVLPGEFVYYQAVV